MTNITFKDFDYAGSASRRERLIKTKRRRERPERETPDECTASVPQLSAKAQELNDFTLPVRCMYQFRKLSYEDKAKVLDKVSRFYQLESDTFLEPCQPKPRQGYSAYSLIVSSLQSLCI
ncbi:hypothetical protein KIPB_013862 [Kipferlia bialata]|uniref:Uncharacterized protein n=1 Tax=Kipferlia bialata TaxID=797122 RepID=A0A9K3D947_9EUKA|nr:hypothetical protein KIPB_013862 [Kipferlia bialata]|eukprot:g13862.t1